MRREPKVSKAAIRRLNAELGVESPMRNLMGLLLGLAIIAGLVGLVSPLVFDIAPAEQAYGVVRSLGFYQREEGSFPRASVVVDGRPVDISLPRTGLCRLGDRVALARRRVLIGVRYSYSHRSGGCTRPATL